MDTNSKVNLNMGRPRFGQLLRCIPDVLNYKSILYVGGHYRFGRDLQLLPYFMEEGYHCDVIEIFDGNIKQLREDKRIRFVFHDDITTFDPGWDAKWDVVLWHHGPEHIAKEQLPGVLLKMERYTRHLVILGAPYGLYEQGAEYGNHWETHLSTWYPEDFQSYGLETDAIGDPDVKNGNIFAWNRLS